MTRPSRRDIERAVEDLEALAVDDLADANGEATAVWASAYLDERLSEGGFAAGFGDAGGERETAEETCILVEDGFSYYTPTDDLPEWVDADEDLPVRRAAPR